MLLRLAKRKKKIKTVPDFNIKLDKSRKRDRIASEEEYAALLANMKRYHQRPLIGLYETSMRLNELLKLTWLKVDEKAGFIRLKAEDTKEKRPRSVPISPALRVVLNELRQEQSQAKVVNLNGHVFTKPNGLPIRNIRDAWLKAKAAAKIEDLRPHDFRHTCITRWEMEGKPAGKIMAASGHHSLEMHNRYVNTKEYHLKDFFAVNEVLTGKNESGAPVEKEAVST
jgi:integrase